MKYTAKMYFQLQVYHHVMLVCACLLGVTSTTYVTQEFVFAFPHARSVVYNEAIHTPYVIVTSPSTCPVLVDISVPGISYTNSAEVSVSRYANFTLPSSAIMGDSTGIYDETIIIKSNGEIRVHGMCTERTSSDGFSVLPASQLDDEYYIALFGPIVNEDPNGEHTTSYSEVSVSALGQATDITITNANGGQLADLTLQPYKTYQLLSGTDLTGAKITATNPVSVVAGNNCAWIPAEFDWSGNCAYIMEQIPGSNSFGQQFVLAPFTGRDSGYIYRVIASMGSTTISINGQTETVLNTQEFYEGNVATSIVVVIESDKPVLVVQFSKDWNTDENGVGNPSMIIVSPTSDYKGGAIIPVTSLSTARSQMTYINVIVSCDQLESLDISNLPTYTELKSSDEKFCVLSGEITSPNVFQISSQTSSTRFLAQVYGFARYEAYSYQVRGHDPESDFCNADGGGEEGDTGTRTTSTTTTSTSTTVPGSGGTGDGDTGTGDGDSGTGDGDTGTGDGDTGTGDGDTGTGDGDTGTGDGDTGTGDGDSGTGDGETGTGDGDSGTGDGETGTGDGDTGTGDGDTGTGDGDTGTGDGDAGTGDGGAGKGDEEDGGNGVGQGQTGDGGVGNGGVITVINYVVVFCCFLVLRVFGGYQTAI